MESIEKLRYYIDHGINHRDELIKLTDEIEREIAEKYMELPVDADGVPIHMGDAMDDGKVAKLVISDDGEHSVYVYKLPNVQHELYCYETAHVKPDPLKELLSELANDVWEASCTCQTTWSDSGLDGIEERYAERIRELLGGDAE